MKQRISNTKKCIAVATIVGAGIFNSLQAQTFIGKDSPVIKATTLVVPGKEYVRSDFHNFFWGKHYRKEWGTGIAVENFYLDTAAGGLTPFKEGGGRQTKNLRLTTKQGKEYVLRSVNKDFGRGLSENIKGTFFNRIAKDQGSFAHPYAAYTITPMIKAAGIYHTNPIIVFVPRQNALKEYNEEYGDQLYLFEERPDENQQDAANFGYSKNVIGSERLQEKIYGDNDNQVDQLAFVRARLFDMFIGDWGRHADNWRWAEFENGKQTIYKPIPRDRDQAYTKIDGLYPDLASALPGYSQLQGFGYTIKNIGGWNYPGRRLDRLFLNGLKEKEWIEQAKELQLILTDSLIETSIRLMPQELFAISGREIINKLKSRRDKLDTYAKDYYSYLAKKVNITGSAKKELIEINVLPGEMVFISVFKINKEGEKNKNPYYSRTFHSQETKELRIYSFDKEDIIQVKGEDKSPIKIRVIDQGAADSISFQQEKNKVKRIKFYSGEKFEYDTTWKKKIKLSIIPAITPLEYRVYNMDPLDLFPRTGLKIAATVAFIPQPWRKEEYRSTHSISALYGFLRTAFNMGYAGRFGRAIGKNDLLIKLRVDAPAVENYFGTGNNTIRSNKTRNYYRTFSQRVYAGIGLERNLGKTHHVEISAIYQSVKYLKKDSPYTNDLLLFEPSVFHRKQFGGIEAGYKYDQTDGSIYPRRGFVFHLGGGMLHQLSDTASAFGKMNSRAAVFLPLNKEFTFAVRAGGGTVFGNPDFYHLNRMGGHSEIRGFARERFYGKSVFYSNMELRWLTNTTNYFFNGRMGLFGFYDTGRVWMPGEKSSVWHDAYGMGVILIPFNKVALTGSYGLSTEGSAISVRAEMAF